MNLLIRNRITILGHLFFLVLVVLSIVFYKERIIHVDNAFYICNIINKEWFSIEHHRYIAVFSQLLPLIAVKLDLALPYILILYSVSLILFYYVLFLVCTYLFKDELAGILLLLLLCVTVAHSFFWPVSELQQGIIFSAVFGSWLIKKDEMNSTTFVLVSLLMSGLLLFSHPMAMFIGIFLLGGVLIYKMFWRSFAYWLVLVSFIIGVMVRFF